MAESFEAWGQLSGVTQEGAANEPTAGPQKLQPPIAEAERTELFVPGGEPTAAARRSWKRLLAPFLVMATFMVLTPPACYLAGLFHVILTGELLRSAFAPGLIILALELGAGFLALGLYWALACGIVEALYRSRNRAPGALRHIPERQKVLLASVLVALLFASPAVSFGVSSALYTLLDLWGIIADGATSIVAVSAFTLIESFIFGTYWYAAVRLFAYAIAYARCG